MESLAALLNSHEIYVKNFKGVPIDLRSPLGVESKNNWIFHYSINEALTLVPISAKEIQQTYIAHYELSRDFMLDKTLLLSLTFFSVAAEIRFLRKVHSLQEDDKVHHLRAIQICKNFLPEQCPLAKHIVNSFKRNYSEALLTRYSSPPKHQF